MRTRQAVGLALIVSAIAVWSGWTLWSRTRAWCPVDVPLSLANETTTSPPEFGVNVSGPYEIVVEARHTTTSRTDALACSLGLEPLWPARTCAVPSVLLASWVLRRSDGSVATGSSRDIAGGSTTSETATRVIGRFVGNRGERYRVTTVMHADATGLSATEPRLKVKYGGTLYEFSLVANPVVAWSTAIVAGVGLILVVSAMIGRHSNPPASKI